MKTYTVQCEWDTTGWWVVTVPDVPGAVTQCRRLDQVDDNVAEVLELMTGETPDSYQLTVDWRVPGPAGHAAAEARELRDQAERVAEELEHTTITAVRRLRAAGFSYRDIGTMTGMSYQRAQQIAHSTDRQAS